MPTPVVTHLAPVQAVGTSRVDEPWGYELRWAVTDHYLGTFTHIDGGQRLGLQRRERRDDSIFIVSGTLDLILEDEEGELRTYWLSAGQSVRIPPGRRHCFMSSSGVDLIEVASPVNDDL